MDNTHQIASKDAVAHARYGWETFTRFAFWGALGGAVITAFVIALIAY